jgi:hypothetical protein
VFKKVDRTRKKYLQRNLTKKKHEGLQHHEKCGKNIIKIEKV